ncbi:MAG TPA: hypothetical protein DD827_04460 [Gammaproteobacteria bacterium]|nr:hypothetical protein [Gammaproteobacteria bacterium]
MLRNLPLLARAGKALKKETVIKMFDVLCKIEKLEEILGNRQSEFLVKKGTKNIIDLNQFIEN